MANQTSYSLTQPEIRDAGMPADMGNASGRTMIAYSTIFAGAPVQRFTGGYEKHCEPFTGGSYCGIARVPLHGVGLSAVQVFIQYENVPVVDEGVWWGRADAAIAAGAGLNWNAATGRWTSAAVAGSIFAVPGAEADTAAAGNGAMFKVRLRRRRPA